MTGKRKLHVLLIHQAFVGLSEAGGTRHYEFARFLAKQGYQVTVITSRVSYLTGKENPEKEGAEGAAGLTILRAGTLGGLHRSFAQRLINFLSFTISSFIIGLGVKKVDLIWGSSPPIFQASTAWALARLKRAPFLLEIRDLWPAFAIAVGVLRNRALIAASNWLERFLYRHADRIILNSPGFADHVKNSGGKQIRVVPNGAEAAMFDPNADGADFRRLHSLQDKFVVLYAGAHGLSNDLGVAMQAAEILRGDKRIRFVLIGDGKDKPSLQDQASRLKLDNVLFLSALPKEQMAEALAAADACLAILNPHPLFATVYPNKVFDYMAAGRPILLAIDGVIRNVIEEAGAGVFIEPGNPSALAAVVRKFQGEAVTVKRMGVAGRIYLEKHFNRPRLAAQMEVVIRELADRHK